MGFQRLKYFLTILCFCGICFFLKAQPLRFKHITNENGLSTNYTSCTAQDKYGFIWFGTQDGLHRYDGVNFKLYKKEPDDHNSLVANDISCLFFDEDLLYIGTNGYGISILNLKTESFENIWIGDDKYKLRTGSVKFITQALDKNYLFIGTEKGLAYYNKKTKEIKYLNLYGTNNSDLNIYSCYIHNSGDVYFGISDNTNPNAITDSLSRIGLATLNKNLTLKKVDLYKSDHSNYIFVKNEYIINSITSHQNLLYLATNSGILIVDPKTNSVKEKLDVNKKASIIKNTINSIDFIDDVAYITTLNGLVTYNVNTKTYTKYEKNESDIKSLNDNTISYLFIDANKNIWINTLNGGINVAFKQSLKFKPTSKLINDQLSNVFAICSDNNDVWVGGESYLKKWNRTTNEITDYSNLVDNKHVLSIKKNGNHLIVGTYYGGIYILNVNHLNQPIVEYENSKIIVDIAVKNKNIWAGSYGDGLFCISPSSKDPSQFSEKEGIATHINCIFFDSNDNLWLGTSNFGLQYIPKDSYYPTVKNVKNYTSTNSKLPSDVIECIYEDERRIIWIATDNGLSALNPKTNIITNYYEKDGLPNNYIHGILPDKQGNLWLSTNKGLCKFNPTKNEFKNYDTKDGLSNTEYTQGAFCKGTNGELFFGSIYGINAFLPEQVKDSKVAPNSYILSLKRNGKDIALDTSSLHKKHIELSWKDNYLDIEFVALDYVDPTKNKLMYILEGYDKTWSEPSNIPYAQYRELPGGNYVFKVKAANSDGVWNEVATTLHITVIPPWYKTKLFYALFALISTTLFIGFIQWRAYTFKQEKRILEAKVAERTNELAERNKDILSSIEYAKRIQEAILPSKEFIVKKLKNVFVLYKPKDIVSGDFYWFAEKNGCKVMAVVDCTGHGVPGAFMSMIGHNLLNQIILEKGITDPGEILNALHKGVQDALRQGRNKVTTNDGMDASVISIQSNTTTIKWAGANRSLIIIDKNKDLEKLEGNKAAIGGAQLEKDRLYTTHTKHLQVNDMVYLFSDGYADQFGGDMGKKYMVKRFHFYLQEISSYPIPEQHNLLATNLKTWQGDYEQIDDVLVVGIRIS